MITPLERELRIATNNIEERLRYQQHRREINVAATLQVASRSCASTSSREGNGTTCSCRSLRRGNETASKNGTIS